jgi:hypothetical protein
MTLKVAFDTQFHTRCAHECRSDVHPHGSGVGPGQRTTCLHTVLGHAHLQVWSTVG